jgi:hypothetical protein
LILNIFLTKISSGKVLVRNIELINTGYLITSKHIKKTKKENKAQFLFYIEGYVRKMHSGGLLPSHFNLSEARSFSIIQFEEYGENWAYFERWAKGQRRKQFARKTWKRIVEIGAVLGFILVAIHLYQLLSIRKG